MHRRYGGFLKLLFEWLFGPIQYPPEAAARVQELAQRGVVVYVTQARSTFLALYFNYALSRLGLPLAAFVGGINLLLWQPLGRLWALLRERRQPFGGPWRARFTDRPPTEAESVLAEISFRGRAAFLFLDPRRRGAGADRPKNDYVRALVAVQRLASQPIFLVPHVLAHRDQAGAPGRSVADLIFGDRRNPRALRRLVMLITGLRYAVVRVGEPIDLDARLAELEGQSDEQAARAVRHELRSRIAEEERVIAGPALETRETLARHVLRNPSLRAEIERQRAAGRDEAVLVRRATDYLKEIAADYSVTIVRFLGALMAWVFEKIYDGVYVDTAGLARVVEASRRGPVIFCPSHKSHVDYLVLSTILWNHGIAPPHIAAGANLSFWPLGPIFRGGGAFFLRRSFKDNPLYKAIFAAYVVELLGRGTSIEFFLEGTRSRTGKLLAPRFGMLHMIVDAFRQKARDDVVLAPVSIDYERIIEASSYEQEVLGREKRPEDMRGLLRSTRVLRSRYGRVHLQFGEPLSLADMARRAGLPQRPDAEHDEAWRRETVRLAYRVLHEIARACSVTPTAVVAATLLGDRGRGLAAEQLAARGDILADFLETEGARLTGGLIDVAERPAAVQRAAQELASDGLLAVDHLGNPAEPFYRVPEARRIQLDYYKNTLMNHFAPASIVARALARRGREHPRLSYEQLRDDCGFLSRLLKSEFVYRVDTTFDSHFDDTVSTLVVRGMLDISEAGEVRILRRDVLDLYATLLDSFVEAYWVLVTGLAELRAFPLWEKELLDQALLRARRLYLEGTIRCPEAQNRTTLATALAWLEGEGYVVIEAGKRRTVHLAIESEAVRLTALVDELAAFLRS